MPVPGRRKRMPTADRRVVVCAGPDRLAGVEATSERDGGDFM